MLLSDDQWTILAGGTDYYPGLRSEPPKGQVLDISKLDDLRGIKRADDHYRVGALTTWSEIAAASLPPAFHALQQAALEVGSVQIQNRATIAGNLCNASPAADGVPPLLALDASVELRAQSATRVLTLQEFLRGYRLTAKKRDELVSAILIPTAALKGVSAFRKLGARKYLVISIGMVAAKLVVEDNIITDAAVAIGACSEVAQRLPAVEQLIIGESAEAHVVAAINPSHLPQIKPISDIRASAEYRYDAAVELVRRTLTDAIASAAGVTHG